MLFALISGLDRPARAGPMRKTDTRIRIPHARGSRVFRAGGREACGQARLKGADGGFGARVLQPGQPDRGDALGKGGGDAAQFRAQAAQLLRAIAEHGQRIAFDDHLLGRVEGQHLA